VVPVEQSAYTTIGEDTLAQMLLHPLPLFPRNNFAAERTTLSSNKHVQPKRSRGIVS
jgi:hypothetical protein